ncbi:hypothetical protein NPIL_529681 [Nephila pilipes]|uniref:Uncharacterized protein n=1 Tax=Nephila pilipes TaxID=299642 RepID=A0A8X6IMC0_NEPPI|nr:hypothetical protein NPIL_529681 [Nephila pilipes]
MRSIGKRAESTLLLCGIMNLPPPFTKLSKLNNTLLQASRETSEESLAEAVREAIYENFEERDIVVEVDGSWQKINFLQ